ncbi:hypothetical protein [Duganella sp. HH105]|uniref:hypothetical protein n=1 Tax=Duganella sp. HH105 TaxID=1781067 RepID=UPI000877B918|nr:hypothetical protein [Duganella sp. HH105]OEZ49754.1 hypothetical protein DUGA6_62750 [Duganella sp. HH105]
MGYHIPVHLPDDVFHALTEHTGEGWYGPKTEAALSELVRNWIRNTAAAPSALDGDAGEPARPAQPAQSAQPEPTASLPQDASKGYQWKQLFLPNGTELRATFGGRSSYAKVQDEAMLCDGAPTTPSRLANARGCGTRNAWHNVWLRFPGEATWKLARRCRS